MHIGTTGPGTARLEIVSIDDHGDQFVIDLVGPEADVRAEAAFLAVGAFESITSADDPRVHFVLDLAAPEADVPAHAAFPAVKYHLAATA